MLAVIVFATSFFLFLALFVARYGGNPNDLRARLLDPGPGLRMTAERLRRLVEELLAKMNMTVVEGSDGGGDVRFVARREEAFDDQRIVVFLEAEPPGGVVDQTAVLELVGEVKAEHAAVGLLFTPYRIATDGMGGLDVPLELIDGPRLRALVAAHLPERLVELDRYRGCGRPRRIPLDLAPAH